MGRRKIEIKAIKDDRNRSVTFLKRKGGLFKKAHELSVLCSVDVAVFIFGNNKKLYEYSSTDMRDLITRYQYHGGPNEHKGPADFNGGQEEDEDDENDTTPPRGHEGLEPPMMPPHFHGQPQFAQMRHSTPSASPPINGAPFPGHHPAHHIQRTHTPQPSIGSRPGSRNDMRRIATPNMMPQPMVSQGGPHPGISYMPTPPIYNPSSQPSMMSQPGQYPYPPQQNHMQPPPHPSQQQPQPPYIEDRRAPMPPAYTPQPPPQAIPALRPEPSPHMPHQQLPPQAVPHISPPSHPQQLDRRPQEPQPPPPREPKTEPRERPQPPQPPLLNTDSALKKRPVKSGRSIFTPIEENRSILSRHLDAFTSEHQSTKNESIAAAATINAANRSQSVDVASVSRTMNTSSPPIPLHRANTQALDKTRTESVSSVPETTFTPPSRSNSFKMGAPGGAGRSRGPRLTVRIPDGASDAESATAESNSPRNPADNTSQAPQRHNSQSSLVLPPPSPSASALLSAGATGPPNPFARPPPQQNVNGDTPVSALPSRFLNTEFLPSPSSFYPDWNFRGSDSNTLPSPLNFATPVVGSGPSFLRDDITATASGAHASSILMATANASGATKRKSPDPSTGGPGESSDTGEAKRVRVQ